MRSVGQTHLDAPFAPAAAAGVLRELDELVPADSGSGRGLLTCGAGVLRELGGLGDPAAVAGAAAGLAAAGLAPACGATRWDGSSLPGANTKTWPTEMR
jgi:hypothetical protein